MITISLSGQDLLGELAGKELEDYLKKTQNAKTDWNDTLARQASHTSLDDLLFNEYFLNLGPIHPGTTETQLYPYWIDTIHELWEERKKRNINLVIFECAIGVGKSYVASVLLWLQFFELVCKGNPHRYFGLDPFSKIAFICMSKTAEQSKRITFSYVADRFKCGFNRDYFPPNPKIASALHIKRGNMLVFPGTSDAASALGYNVYTGNLDECNFVQLIEESKKALVGEVYDPSEEWYNAISTRMASRFIDPESGGIPGFITMMSSPTYPDSFLERKIKQAESGEATDIFFKRASLWKVKPAKRFFPRWYTDKITFTFDNERASIVTEEEAEKIRTEEGEDKVKDRFDVIPIDLIQTYKLDGERAIRDISGRPQEALSPFFRNKKMIDIALKPEIHNPFNEETLKFDEDFLPPDSVMPSYYMHVDLAVSKDSVGISMCHREGSKVLKRENVLSQEIMNEEVELPVVKFDFVGRIQGEKGREIILADVRDVIYELRNRGFDIALITFDQWQSVDSIQILRDSGFVVDNLSIDRTFHKIVVDYDKTDTFTKKESTGKNYVAPMQDLKCAMYEERIDIPYHEWLRNEFRWAEWDLKKNKVDHPPGKSIDVLHSVAGSFFNCTNNEGALFAYGSGLEDPRQFEDKFYKEIEGVHYTQEEDPYYKQHQFEDNFFDKDEFGGDDDR